MPNDSFVDVVILHLQIQNVPANVYLPRGWSLAAINNISFILGSSNVPNLQVTGQSLFQWIMSSVEMQGKRTDLLSLMGEEVITATSEINAYIPLYLPFSKMGGSNPKLPLDTSMLNSPITIQIAFNPATSFMMGSGTYPTAFSTAQIYFHQADLTNKNLSIGRILKSDSTMYYNYPFIHAQSGTGSYFTGSSNTSTPNSLNLQSFINADLVGLSIGVVLTSQQSANANQISPFNYLDLSNIRLLYNGLPMYVAPRKMYKMWELVNQLDSQYVQNTLVNSGTTSPFTSTPVNTYILMIDFGRIRSTQFEGQFQNTWRIPNQTMTIEFNVPSGANSLSCVLYPTYYYNGIAEFSRGESRIYFN